MFVSLTLGVEQRWTSVKSPPPVKTEKWQAFPAEVAGEDDWSEMLPAYTDPEGRFDWIPMYGNSQIGKALWSAQRVAGLLSWQVIFLESRLDTAFSKIQHQQQNLKRNLLDRTRHLENERQDDQQTRPSVSEPQFILTNAKKQRIVDQVLAQSPPPVPPTLVAPWLDSGAATTQGSVQLKQAIRKIDDLEYKMFNPLGVVKKLSGAVNLLEA